MANEKSRRVRRKNPGDMSDQQEVRIQFDLLPERAQEIEQLMARTGSQTRRILFENALTLLEIAVNLTEENKRIGVFDETRNQFVEIIFAPLVNASKGRKKS